MASAVPLALFWRLRRAVACWREEEEMPSDERARTLFEAAAWVGRERRCYDWLTAALAAGLRVMAEGGTPEDAERVMRERLWPAPDDSFLLVPADVRLCAPPDDEPQPR